MLSARAGEQRQGLALDAGADDYVTKPFGMDELLARLRAALRRDARRRASPGRRDRRTSPSTSPPSGAPRADGAPVRLTPTEWHLLEVLLRNEGKLVAQRQLLQEVWGPQYETETNYLRVYMAQLRRKLEPDPAAPAPPDHRAGHGLPLRRVTRARTRRRRTARPSPRSRE